MTEGVVKCNNLSTIFATSVTTTTCSSYVYCCQKYKNQPRGVITKTKHKIAVNQGSSNEEIHHCGKGQKKIQPASISKDDCNSNSNKRCELLEKLKNNAI